MKIDISDKRVQDVILDTVTTAVSNGITVILSKDDAVIHSADETKTPCAGFFCGNDVENDLQIAVAMGKPIKEWLPVFLHESSHMDQYLENCDAWKNIVLEDGTDTSDALFNWIAGKDVDNIRDCALRSLNVELDCEKRTLQKIHHYELWDYINAEEYIQKSNAYVYFYLYMLETRKFYEKGKAPYTIKEVWSAAPMHFNGDYTVIPEELYRAFKQYL